MRFRTKAIPLLVVILASAAMGCDDNPLSPTPVRNVTWKLESIERTGTATITIPNPDQYTVRFEENGSVAVRADCNSCTGHYTLEGSSLAIGSVACTRVACQIPALDTAFTAALTSVRSVRVSGNQLTVSGEGFTLRFRN